VLVIWKMFTHKNSIHQLSLSLATPHKWLIIAWHDTATPICRAHYDCGISLCDWLTCSIVIILLFLLGNNYLAPTIGHAYEKSLAYPIRLTLSTYATHNFQFVTPPVHWGSIASSRFRHNIYCHVRSLSLFSVIIWPCNWHIFTFRVLTANHNLNRRSRHHYTKILPPPFVIKEALVPRLRKPQESLQ